MRRPCMLIAIKTPAKNAEQWRSGEVRRAARRMPTSTRPDLAWGWRCSGALCSVLSAGSRRERWVRDQTSTPAHLQHLQLARSTLPAQPKQDGASWPPSMSEGAEGSSGPLELAHWLLPK
ncbi:hypothetical protein L207DRAFT_1925 [Hyaloscypha variabilis F]|uniref:Uncharacterized protein n=1 Tax=Hyaloscypha variabilis (strain UAMH 11265 / GT02V1 / F) TaxID=1149755 RepID=A0A2J6SBP6_HYAVF|nr:hypothetical protein L207DRAFT_1925 [Hyaloscypha variabilis F]